MDTTIAARPRGKRVILLLDHLLSKPEGALAAELAVIAGVHSKQVYPLLQWWIRRGIVEVTKSAGYNIYRLSSRIRKALQHILRTILRSRELRVAELAKRLIEHKLMRRLTPTEQEVIAMLAERLLAASPYLRIRAENPRNALDILRTKLYARLASRGLEPQVVSRLLLELDESIEELREEGILYIYWDARNRTLVLRLDKSLEEQLAHLL